MKRLPQLILDGVDPETESRVIACVNRSRDRMRDALKDAYMFALAGRRGARHSITVSVERGDAVLTDVLSAGDELGQALSGYRQAIAGGLGCVARLRGALEYLDGPLSDELSSIYPHKASREFEHFLLMMDRRIEEASVVKFLLELTRDFLGAYEPAERSGHITLHWGLLGLVCPQLGVSVEALTLKVLAHEYGHALSHLGLDADGQHWPLKTYWQADLYVHEGLANYFSAHALAASDDWWFREALNALETLSERQEEPYREYRRWTQELRVKPEAVRAALRMARTMPAVSRTEFEHLLRDYASGR